MGGVYLAGELFNQLNGAGIDAVRAFLEKKVDRVATENERELSHLIFGRHQPAANDIVIIVEDTVNNRSTADEAISLFESVGAVVLRIVSAINRSYPFVSAVQRDGKPDIAITATIESSTPQWEQCDPEIAEDLTRLGFVAKPKHNRAQLQQIMNKARGEAA